MNKTTIFKQYRSNAERIAEMCETLKKEQRTRNAAEETEYQTLVRENQILEMQLRNVDGVSAPTQDLDAQLREAIATGSRNFTVALRRETMTTAGLEGTGLIPVNEQEMLKPLREGLIWERLGIRVPTGLKGYLRWPKHGKAVASFADEGARLTDSSIDFSALEMTGSRLGVAIPVTEEELTDTGGVVESVIREEMPAAIVDKINEAMFATSTTGRKIYGPFANCQQVEFLGESITRADLLKAKSLVLGSGIKPVAPCWCMNEATKAYFEDLKVDAGSGRFVCEEGKILGYPVITTEHMEDNVVGFGDWSYQAAGFFGNADLIVDPYTLARNHATDFVLNWRFGTATLRPEAFVILHEGDKA